MSLRGLPSIGVTLDARLAEIGVTDLPQLVSLGPAHTYRLLCARHGGRLPVCYYLYSLHGAITGRDWRDLSDTEKRELCAEAGVSAHPTRTRRRA